MVGISIFVLARFGLLALISTIFFYGLNDFYPMTSDFSAWYTEGAAVAVAVAVAIVLYGFYASLGGQPLFRGGGPLRD